MADDKKKDDKKKEEPKPKSGVDLFMPLIVLVGGALFLSLFLKNWNGVFFDSQGDILSFPRGPIAIGEQVIDKETALVRDVPAGAVLGSQERFKKALVADGPQTAYGKRWWMLHYEDAPDGFVIEDSLTSYVGIYTAFHILPIIWPYVSEFLWFISILLIALLVYAKVKLAAAREEASRKLGSAPSTMPHIVVGREETAMIGGQALPTGTSAPQEQREENERWMHVLQLLQSYNESDWRQAIIEADIVLEEMLEKMQYQGQTIGDKLKNVEPSDFLTLNQAWEAHKVRNKIAHLGSDFHVSQQEAKRVIGMYQEVFEEFYFI